MHTESHVSKEKSMNAISDTISTTKREGTQRGLFFFQVWVAVSLMKMCLDCLATSLLLPASRHHELLLTSIEILHWLKHDTFSKL